MTDFDNLPKIFNHHFSAMKAERHPITALTAYDYPTAELLDGVGLELILVGDSLGMVVQGKPTTIGVTLEEMLYHCNMVSGAVKRAMVCLDMPFMSYQANQDTALYNAGRCLAEGGAGSVKVEGARMDLIHRMVENGIPVLAHLGCTPQSYHQFGGYTIVGKDVSQAKQLLSDGLAVEEAGAYALVLECVPTEVAQTITGKLSIPTIGIGAGPHCDGQILVLHDILGLYHKIPRHVKVYKDLNAVIRRAVLEYRQDVRRGDFPGEDNYYRLDNATQKAWQKVNKEK